MNLFMSKPKQKKAAALSQALRANLAKRKAQARTQAQTQVRSKTPGQAAKDARNLDGQEETKSA